MNLSRGRRHQPGWLPSARGCAGGSGGWGLPGSLVVLAGPGGDDDVVAEGIELGEVVPDLAPGLGVLVVVAGPQVLVARARVGQELVVDRQLGVADRDLGFVLADAAGQPPVACSLAGLGAAG